NFLPSAASMLLDVDQLFALPFGARLHGSRVSPGAAADARGHLPSPDNGGTTSANSPSDRQTPASYAPPATAAMNTEAHADALIHVAGNGPAVGPARRHAAAVHALFNLDTPEGGPFASDRFTVSDPSQNTGRRVNLPLPDRATHPSDYNDTQLLNTLDGFNLQPRLSVPFDGAIDVHSVTSQTMFLVSLGDTLNHHDHGGQV